MNLVFEGGGIKGLCYIGALRYLESRGMKINKCAGTSIGAIIASLVVAGYSSIELEQIVSSLDVDKLWPKRKKKLNNALNVIKNKAIYSMKFLEEQIRVLLKKRGIYTFKDLRCKDGYRLKVIVTSLEKKKMVVLPEGIREFGYDPDNLDVASAVCMSASLPFVYPPYKYRNYNFVDGGIMDNFPMWLFSENVYGFSINNKKKHKQKNIIYINTTGYRSTSFRKGMEEKYVLYNRGYYYTKIFFDDQYLISK